MHSQTYHGEAGYLQMMRDILEHGVVVPDRTGVGRRKIFDVKLCFDLREGFPASTVRMAGLRVAQREFWAFLNGVTLIDQYLRNLGVVVGDETVTLENGDVVAKTIWSGNTSREFLNGRGLGYLPEGHMGKSYGFQFRHYGGDYDENFCPVGGVDQIAKVFNGLKNDPFGSRHVVTLLNPAQEAEMALPPCWHTHQFLAIPQKDGSVLLNLKVYSRSADTLFGTPFNVQQYALYLSAMAKALGYVAGILTCELTDAHLYENQIEYTRETVAREIFQAPKLVIKKELSTLDDVLSLDLTDFELVGLVVNKKPYMAKRPAMAV